MTAERKLWTDVESVLRAWDELSYDELDVMPAAVWEAIGDLRRILREISPNDRSGA